MIIETTLRSLYDLWSSLFVKFSRVQKALARHMRDAPCLTVSSQSTTLQSLYYFCVCRHSYTSAADESASEVRKLAHVWRNTGSALPSAEED